MTLVGRSLVQIRITLFHLYLINIFQAGEEAGSIEGAKVAAATFEAMIAKAVLETAELVGFEIAGELGVEAAKATALEVGKKAGAACAASLGATIGSEVGRIAGFQGASVAAAEELAKMNMNEITEEKAAELKGQFVDLGKSVGAATGAKAAAEAAKDIDIAAVLREAKAVAKEAAEEGALLAKLLTNAANDEARLIGKTPVLYTVSL